MADKITTNFEATRALMFELQQPTRSQRGANQIAAACRQLGFDQPDTFRMFAVCEYVDQNTGEPFNYGRRGKTQNFHKGKVLWNFDAYQEDVQAKGK